jgi:hypothetical protein
MCVCVCVCVCVDFVLGFPRLKRVEAIFFVVVDIFFKMTHFISYHKTDDTTNIVDLFFKKIVWLYGVLRNIVSDRDVKFLSYF